jgi:hypothetical protein
VPVDITRTQQRDTVPQVFLRLHEAAGIFSSVRPVVESCAMTLSGELLKSAAEAKSLAAVLAEKQVPTTCNPYLDAEWLQSLKLFRAQAQDCDACERRLRELEGFYRQLFADLPASDVRFVECISASPVYAVEVRKDGLNSAQMRLEKSVTSERKRADLALQETRAPLVWGSPRRGTTRLTSPALCEAFKHVADSKQLATSFVDNQLQRVLGVIGTCMVELNGCCQVHWV